MRHYSQEVDAVGQNNSNKVVSLHLEACDRHCPHSSICYHDKKGTEQLSGIGELVQRCVDEGYIVYDSVCTNTRLSSGRLLVKATKHKNYNFTFSIRALSRLNREIRNIASQIQVSVYDKNEIADLYVFQKLFLIHDYNSFNLFTDTCGCDCGKLHYNIDQKNIDFDTLKVIIRHFNDNGSKGQSLDSCVTSWIVNGCCPYENDNNYIDISHDRTVRKCPFNPVGTRTTEKTRIKDMFHLQVEPFRECKYKQYFGGKE